MSPSTDTATTAGTTTGADTTTGEAGDPTIDLSTTYLVACPDGAVPHIAVDESFWPDVMAGRHPELGDGWMIGAFDYAADWDSWEAHPAGDEVVMLLSGHLEMVLELDGREWSVDVPAGRTVVVPRGAWHRAIVHEPGRAVHVTLGAGKTHRPYPG